jgi:magnesium chelatase family protein
VTIGRVDGALTMPANFSLLAAFNPCPCGWLGARSRSCTCEQGSARRYASRLSGPLRDRIDLWVTMDAPHPRAETDGVEPSSVVALRVAAAWRRQRDRQGIANGELPPRDMVDRNGFSRELLGLLAQRGRRFGLSPRRLHRAGRVARTIADLAGSSEVSREHLDEALRYRSEAAR